MLIRIFLTSVFVFTVMFLARQWWISRSSTRTVSAVSRRIRAPHRWKTDAEKLRAAGMPVLDNPKEIAAWLGVSWRQLIWLAEIFGPGWKSKTYNHYIVWKRPKRSGGERVITAPKPYLRAVQRQILRHILNKASVEPQAHGFIAERSVLTNAQPHVGALVVVKLDLMDFFPTITLRRVRGVFKRLGYTDEIGTLLARLCTITRQDANTLVGMGVPINGRHKTAAYTLPQGAPTSPALSNLVCRRMDRRLSALATKFGAKYTRYADDMTFSGDEKFAADLGDFFNFARKIIREEGFAINWPKRQILRRGRRQNVTGIVVNHHATLPRDERKLLRAIMHRWKTTGDFEAPAGVSDKKMWLQGKLAYFSMIDPEKAAPLDTAFYELNAKFS